MKKILKIFFINSIILIISSIFIKILSIYFNSYIVKKIGKEMFGEFNLIISVYIFGTTIGNFGINFAITRLVSENLAIGNYDHIKKTSKYCIFISFFFGTIASTLFLLFSNFIIKICLHNKISKNVIYIICLTLPFISISSTISGYFIAVRRIYKSTIVQFFEQITKIFLTAFILNLFLPNGLEYACFSLILGDFISEIFSCLYNYILYVKDIKTYNTSYIIHNKTNIFYKKILKISTPIAITSLLRSGLSTLKQIIIPISFEKGKINCSKSLSIYGEINGMAMPIIFFPNIIFSSISNLLIPEFSAYNYQKKEKTIKNITKLIILITILLSISVSVLLLFLSDNLGNWIYNDNHISYYIKILSPLTFFILMDCVIDNILKGLNVQNTVMIINILDTFIDVILIYFLVPKFGISGYIISIYLSEIFNFTLSFKKLIKVVFFKNKVDLL